MVCHSPRLPLYHPSNVVVLLLSDLPRGYIFPWPVTRECYHRSLAVSSILQSVILSMWSSLGGGGD